ncbi:NTP transferase domain-containing protein [Candidatus Obscuribacterales bacterium]|nr:NTP transferase domain-containing protein [Candidatus Obscuribacterales bacterium]
MINSKSVLAVVSAIGGCKTLARRDSRMLGGKPLFAWSVNTAKNSRSVDRIVVVTDDNEVRSYSQAIGATVIAVPPEKETGMDRASFATAVALREFAQYDMVAVIDAGAPLILGSDLDGVLEVSLRNHGTPVVTVSETRLSPASLVVLDTSRKMRKVFGNQDPVPPNTRIYTTSSAISASAVGYVQTHGTFLTEDTHAFLLAPERSLIVESKADLVVAEGFLKLTGPGSELMPFNSSVSSISQ